MLMTMPPFFFLRRNCSLLALQGGYDASPPDGPHSPAGISLATSISNQIPLNRTHPQMEGECYPRLPNRPHSPAGLSFAKSISNTDASNSGQNPGCESSLRTHHAGISLAKSISNTNTSNSGQDLGCESSLRTHHTKRIKRARSSPRASSTRSRQATFSRFFYNQVKSEGIILSTCVRRLTIHVHPSRRGRFGGPRLACVSSASSAPKTCESSPSSGGIACESSPKICESSASSAAAWMRWHSASATPRLSHPRLPRAAATDVPTTPPQPSPS